jgi:hypothetical protein
LRPGVGGVFSLAVGRRATAGAGGSRNLLAVQKVEAGAEIGHDPGKH